MVTIDTLVNAVEERKGFVTVRRHDGYWSIVVRLPVKNMEEEYGMRNVEEFIVYGNEGETLSELANQVNGVLQ